MIPVTMSWLTKTRPAHSEPDSQHVVQNVQNQQHGDEYKDRKMDCGELGSIASLITDETI